MKILYITNGYKPNRWAGTETYTAGIAEEIAKRQHSVEILCAGEWEIGNSYWNGASKDIQNGIPVRRLNFSWQRSPDPFRYLYDNPAVESYLRDLLREEKYDLVHVTSCETLSASVFRVVKDEGLPLVFSITDFWFLCPRINLLHADGSNCNGRTSPMACLDCLLTDSGIYGKAKKILPEQLLFPIVEGVSQFPLFTRMRGLRGMAGNMKERKAMLKQALTLPDVRTTASNFVREIFVANDVSVPINVNPYGHDLSWLKTYHGKSDSKVIRFGYIGQIVSSKGVHLILQAMSYLSEALSERFSLVIYGNLEHVPSYGHQIRDLASRFSNVSFGGTYPHSDSARVFSDIDVLLVPSVWYDFPLIIYEAFAAQTPVIATNLGGMAEAVSHDVSGLLFERGNALDLSKQLQRIIEEPGLLQRLVTGISHVRTVSEEVDDLEGIYTDLVQETNRIFQP